MRSAPCSAEPAAAASEGRHRRSRLAKQAFDRLAAGLGLVLLAPLLLVLALLIRRDDGGPVFFRQERVGCHGRPFSIWKFRTMRVDTGQTGPLLTVGGDPRITPIGRRLRRTKLDELPQLLNVLMGQMSLVGPRPEVARYVALYTAAQRSVLALMPGITDPASLAFIDEERLLAAASDPEALYRERIMPRKIALNLDYAATAGLWSDLGIILRTVARMAPR